MTNQQDNLITIKVLQNIFETKPNWKIFIMPNSQYAST